MSNQQHIISTISGNEYMIIQDVPNGNTFSIIKNGVYHGYTTLDVILHGMHEV